MTLDQLKALLRDVLEKEPEIASLIELMASECHWTAGVFHQWEEGRGSRKFTNASIASIDGKFATREEAEAAVAIAIKNRSVRSRGHSVNYSRAKPSVSFCIPHAIQNEIGNRLAAILAQFTQTPT